MTKTLIKMISFEYINEMKSTLERNDNRVAWKEKRISNLEDGNLDRIQVEIERFLKSEETL